MADGLSESQIQRQQELLSKTPTKELLELLRSLSKAGLDSVAKAQAARAELKRRGYRTDL